MCVFGELLWRFLKAHTPSLARYAQAAEERAGGDKGASVVVSKGLEFLLSLTGGSALRFKGKEASISS